MMQHQQRDKVLHDQFLKMRERLREGEDVLVDTLAAKTMARPEFAGDYEMAIDSALLDIALAAGDFD